MSVLTALEFVGGRQASCQQWCSRQARCEQWYSRHAGIQLGRLLVGMMHQHLRLPPLACMQFRCGRAVSVAACTQCCMPLFWCTAHVQLAVQQLRRSVPTAATEPHAVWDNAAVFPFCLWAVL